MVLLKDTPVSGCSSVTLGPVLLDKIQKYHHKVLVDNKTYFGERSYFSCLKGVAVPSLVIMTGWLFKLQVLLPFCNLEEFCPFSSGLLNQRGILVYGTAIHGIFSPDWTKIHE